MKALEDFTQLLFPTRCYGCRTIGLSICSKCRQEWHPHYYSTHISHMRVHSAVLYSPTASKIVLAAKENGLKGADDLIIDAIVHVLLQARFDSLNIHLVPIPSSASTRRYRGRSFMVDITQKVAELTSFPISDCLQLVRKVRDQSTLPARSRLINMEGAIGIKAGAHPRGDLILIDDVMTTGATLGEAARALRAHGSGPIASVTACVSQPLR